MKKKRNMRAVVNVVGAVGMIMEAQPKYFKEPPQPEEDASATLKNSTYLTIKNAFSLAYGDDEQLKISVDNIFPLLKSLGLNPQSEEVVDLVREASIETFGDINLTDFENVVLGMVKQIDETLWEKRLEEKDRLHHEREAAKASAEADRLRLEQERQKAGFEKEEDDTDEWQEYERKLKEEAEKKEKELKEDELYDNLKMAFRFIDADEDGVISTQDLYVLMMGLGEMMTDDELFGMVNMADCDCDGKVTFEDFKKFLLPQSGDENLILSPAAIAQQLLLSGTNPTGTIQPEVTENDAELADEKNELVTDKTETSEDTQKTVANTHSSEKEDSKANNNTPDLSDEERARIQKRRQSMLWGYMNAPKSSTNSRRTSVPSITSVVDEVFELAEQESTVSIESVKETGEDFQDGDSADVKASTPTEGAGQFLGAIREEDEHSNYGIVNNDDENNVPDANNTSENKFTSALEAKRKLFSRQSSSASLKTKNTDSFGDSGIETMDSVNCSEIRDQPDVFDISDSEADGEKKSKLRRPSLSDAIYSGNEDDEDMIDPLHVHESLSRVSSSDSLLKLDLESDERLPQDSSDEDAEERVRNFVNEHTYIEIQPTPPRATQEEIERQVEIKRLAEERINRAHTLERAIMQRSFTSPALTLYRSKLERPLTARPSVNGIHCSHIDIDLRCDEPPKADIKSMRQFKERVNSARSSRRDNQNQFRRNMSVIDISESIYSDENLQNETDRQKWPMRPLTRPRSPVGRKLFSPCEKLFSLDLETDEFERLNQSREKRGRRRAKSAAPLRRSCSPSPPVTGVRKNTERPMTASLPYTSSRYENDKKRNVLVVEPLANADELYPNKTTLTTFHHGFRSIWPIGRKINLIQTKKPFQAFEMNSYSRNIERRQFPFKADHNIKTTTQLIKTSTTETLKNTAGNKNAINLDMKTKQMKRPSVRKLSLYITPNSTPRAVR
ncbi:uncharacterized protein LOC123540609 isoform X2 [Mercenaria mercenaria]|uniref:uncharacterized protein LOC123540609 isoform X2 n=1 Tax=Mercenaria mercenaria TaxID=6596 RepID=UPI00234E5372|nr:uncharacterized protein LOC123540609 isoform X2 [Mercenaria mercenaria]